MAAPYRRALIQAGALQFCWLVLAGMMLDMGEFGSAVIYSSTAFWAGVLLVLIRRPRAPTRGDLLYVRWGILPVVWGGTNIFLAVWKAKGVM